MEGFNFKLASVLKRTHTTQSEQNILVEIKKKAHQYSNNVI
jgi:hypothetical protein